MVLRKLRTRMTIFLWVVAAIFILFIFLEWGLEFTSTRKLTPIERGIIGMVNGTPISYSTYSNRIEYYRNQGNPLWKCSELAFNALVEEVLVNEVLKKQKIELTDEEVVEVIRNNPPQQLLQDTMFYTDGKFDFNKYHAMMSNPANIGWLESYEEAIRTQVPRQFLYQIITSAVRPTTIELVEAYMMEKLKLQLEYAVIDSTQFDITEPILLEYYDTHKDEFIIPELPIINYVVFKATPTTEDELYIKEEAKELFELAKNGAPIESLATEYGYTLLETNPPVDSLIGPIKKEDGYHIMKGDKDLLIPIRASDETMARIEEEANHFIEAAKYGFEETASASGLEVQKVTSLSIPGVNLSYIDTKTEGKLIGPIEGPACFYVLYTLGTKKAYTPDFHEIKDKIYNKYWRYKAAEFAQQLIQQTSSTNFKEKLSANGLEVKIQELSNQDSLVLRNLFLKASNIPEGGIATVSTDKGIYLVHCLKRQEPPKEEVEKELPDFNANWMKEEAERIYGEWINNLKTHATIKDYRYKIH